MPDVTEQMEDPTSRPIKATKVDPKRLEPTDEDLRKGEDKKIQPSKDHNRGIEDDSYFDDPPQDKDFENREAVDG